MVLSAESDWYFHTLTVGRDGGSIVEELVERPGLLIDHRALEGPQAYGRMGSEISDERAYMPPCHYSEVASHHDRSTLSISIRRTAGSPLCQDREPNSTPTAVRNSAPSAKRQEQFAG